MTSKIIVNQIEADADISSVTFNDTISGNLDGNVTGPGTSTFNGSVGIGTDNPAVHLDVYGEPPRIRLVRNSTGVRHDIRGNADNLSIRADSSNIGADTTIDFQIDGSEKARIIPDGSGQLLVGTTVGVGSTTQNIQVLQQILAPQGIIGNNGGWSRVPDRLVTRTNASDLINNHTYKVDLTGLTNGVGSNGSVILFVTFTLRRGNTTASYSQKSQYMGLWHITRQSTDLAHVDANNLVTNNMTIDGVATNNPDGDLDVTITFDTSNVRSFTDHACHFCTSLSSIYPGTTA